MEPAKLKAMKATTAGNRFLRSLDVPEGDDGKSGCGCPPRRLPGQGDDGELPGHFAEMPPEYRLLAVVFGTMQEAERGHVPRPCVHSQEAGEGFPLREMAALSPADGTPEERASDVWAAMLLEAIPENYRERPLPAQPMHVLSKEARITVYRERAEAGEAVFHPLDLKRDQEGVALKARSGKRLAEIEGYEDEVSEKADVAARPVKDPLLDGKASLLAGMRPITRRVA